MSHKYVRHFTLGISMLVAGLPAIAQTSTSSSPLSGKLNDPYTRYGLGSLSNGSNVLMRGMGSLSSAYASPFAVNTENPASYTSLALTTYEAGGEATMMTVYSNNQSYSTGTGTLSYLNIGIPIGKKRKGGIAFGLKPQTRVYYKLVDSTYVNGMGNSTYVYSGDGGLNYAYAGGAYRVGGLSIGVNFGYMFGTIRNSSVIQSADTFNVLSSEFTRYNKVGGIYWKAGAQYEAKLNSKLKLRLGATGTLGQDLNVWRDNYYVNFAITGGSTVQDTSYYDPSIKGKIHMPLSYSFGAQLMGNDKWSVGVDYQASKWSQYRNFDMQDSVTDAYKVSVGAEFTPNPSSLYNYFQRVTYRVGAYYGTDYVKLKNTDITYYAFTVGASLPFKRSTDRLHVALEVGKRGTETAGLVKENFVRFSLGISLNDKWFIKRKYD